VATLTILHEQTWPFNSRTRTSPSNLANKTRAIVRKESPLFQQSTLFFSHRKCKASSQVRNELDDDLNTEGEGKLHLQTILQIY